MYTYLVEQFVELQHLRRHQQLPAQPLPLLTPRPPLMTLQQLLAQSHPYPHNTKVGNRVGSEWRASVGVAEIVYKKQADELMKDKQRMTIEYNTMAEKQKKLYRRKSEEVWGRSIEGSNQTIQGGC